MNDRKRREKEGPKSRGAKEKESAMIKGKRMREKERIKDETKRNKEEKVGASKNGRKKEENGRIEKLGRGKEEQKGVKAKKEREEGKTKKNKEEREEEYYEDDFEEYESDFEADEGENEGEKNIELAENGRDGAEEHPSLLLEKLAARGREKDEAIRNRRPDEQIGRNGGMEKGQKEVDFVIPEQRELAIGRKGEKEGGGKKGSKEWMVEYFREVAGQSERRKQVGTQTDGPELSVGSQTESPEKEESEMQTGEMALEQKVGKGEENVDGPNRRRLAFLKEAGQLMSGLLRLSSLADEPSLTPGSKNHSNLLPFSSGHSIFSLNSLFKENRPCAIALKNPQTICLCVFVSNSEDPMQVRKSFGAEISLENPSELRRLICADHEIIFLRYSPGGSFLFAALKDGSLAAWDLLNGDEIQMKGNNKLDEPILKPIVNTAFSQLGKWETGGAAKEGENWADLGIVGMEMMRGRGGRTVAHLVVLHESGLIRCWAALEGAGNDALEWDGFGGVTKTKLQLMATSNARCIPAAPTNTEFATSLAIDGQIVAFVGTSKGRILRVNPINGKADWRDGPSVFNADPDGNSEVTSIKFPFSGKGDMFAAATMDQRVMLFSLAKTEPYRIVAANLSANHHFGLQMPILLEWSPIDQSILFSIHAGEEILVLRREGKESFQFFREFRSRIHCTLTWAGQSGNAFLAFGLSNGETHVHSLK